MGASPGNKVTTVRIWFDVVSRIRHNSALAISSYAHNILNSNKTFQAQHEVSNKSLDRSTNYRYGVSSIPRKVNSSQQQIYILKMSSGSLLFVIVGRNEPLFEAEIHKRGTSSGKGTSSDAVSRQNYFVLHSALDLVDKAAWNSSQMYLKVVDKVCLSAKNIAETIHF